MILILAVHAQLNALIFRDVTVMRHPATNGGNRQLNREFLHAYYVDFMMHLMQMHPERFLTKESQFRA